MAKHFLVASDFDQTLSFNDSGVVLSELIGASRFQEKVAGLGRTNLVQQGGELAYLITLCHELGYLSTEAAQGTHTLESLSKDTASSPRSWTTAPGPTKNTKSPSPLPCRTIPN